MKIVGMTNRLDCRFNDVLIAKRIRVVLEMTVVTKSSCGSAST